MRFLCKGLKFGLLKTNYFRFCANVCRAVTMRLLRNRHHFKLMKSKFKGKENLSPLVYVLKKNFLSGNFMSL